VTIKTISMYGSPWSERVRWALAFKGVQYEKQNYEPSVDEAAVKKLTGQAMVPVLIADGKVIPDSSAILDWLEQTKREPALLPKSAKERAIVTLWEEVALNALGPHGRTLITGRLLRIGDPAAQKSGKYFAEKYGYSEFAEDQSRLTVTRILTSLKDTLSGRQYLVGEAFTRADLTVAAMLMLLKAAPQELFIFTPELRMVYLDKLGDDPAFSDVFAWRDRMYQRHRCEIVKP